GISMNKIKVVCVFVFLAFGLVILFTRNSLNPTVKSNSTGPPAAHTGAPDESTCSECHFPGRPAQTDSTTASSFSITAPANYTPGQTYQVQVQHVSTDPTRRR